MPVDESISACEFETNVNPSDSVSVVMNEHVSASPIVLNGIDSQNEVNASEYNCDSEKPTGQDQVDDPNPIHTTETSMNNIDHKQSANIVESPYCVKSILKTRVRLHCHCYRIIPDVACHN
ncbi:hypothetical protein QAD02_002551 [Eretmocerus hayati]|uniref:Uncharacterized protein n=1 Tax=Eretmocerus hayati TaxID=131215 RepID=A0ACC2NM47_9HYME|nr:hypothetical protein QAD02_002551 [Eretmocerus hayati]